MLLGILAIVTASIIFGIVPSANKYILLSGMTSECIVLYMTFIMTLGTAAVIIRKRRLPKAKPRDMAKMLLLGIAGMGLTDYLLAQAYNLLPVGIVTMLHFLYPAIVMTVMTAGFHQKMTALKAGALALSLIGLGLTVELSGGIHVQGVFYALGSACAYAFYIIGNDRGSINRFPLIVKLFYASLGGCCFFGAKTAVRGSFSLPAGTTVFLLLAGVVGCGSLAAFYLVTVGIKRLGAEKAGFLNMLEPVTSIAVSVLLYKEVMNAKTWAGCICIMLSVLVITLNGN